MSEVSARREAAPWMVWAALWVVYIVWGSTYLAIRVVVETMPPLLSAAIRFLVAGGAMYVVLLLKRGPSGVRVTAREIGASTLVGAALLLGGNGLVALAERDVPSSLAALIIASVPLWVILLRKLFDGGAPRGTLIGVVAGFTGVAILLLPGERPEGATLLGMLVVVAASAFWATGSFFSKRLPLPSDPLTSTAVQMLMGGLVLAVVGLATGEASGLQLSDFSRGSWIALVYLIVAGSWLAFTAYTWLLQNAPISKVATYAYVNPVIAILLGWLLLDEQITSTILIGATIIVASVATIVRRESGPRIEPERREPVPTPAGAEALEPSRP